MVTRFHFFNHACVKRDHLKMERDLTAESVLQRPLKH